MSSRLIRMAPVLFLAAACGGKKEPPPPWSPGTTYPSSRTVGPRGFLDLRGIIHAHTVYSHDACDDKPRLADDSVDPVCLEDFRRGLCQSRHDFVFLTDHAATFSRTEFPDVLLYDASRGDELVLRTGLPVANRMACPDAPAALLIAGCETDIMPVGFDRHVPGTIAERDALLHQVDATAIESFHAAGGLALMAHTELWNADELAALPLDGFEMYNLHYNAYVNGGEILGVLAEIEAGAQDLPHPDLLFLVFTQIDTPAYIDTWGSILAKGLRRVTTMATDCHRNSFPQIASDGERIDSYRRMMNMFSNHLFVRPGTDGSWDDEDLQGALAAGRLYGAFEFVGYPEGFDFYAEEGGTAVREMGETASIAKGVRLVVRRPNLARLDAQAQAPRIRVRLLRAIPGGWEEVAQDREGDLDVDAKEPGAYRAEVRIVPMHVMAFAGKRPDLVRVERPWIYANPIYVTP